MDEALSKIKQLSEELKKLQNDKLQKENEITKYSEENSSLEYKINISNKKISELNINKYNTQIAPKTRKSEKASLIISLILSYLVISLIAFLAMYVGSGGVIPVLAPLGVSTLCMGFISSIIIPIQFKKINKKYPIANLSNIENDILSETKHLNKLKNRLKQNKEIINGLKTSSFCLENQIKELIDKIDYINNLRTEVIDEYCKNNPTLEQKLNDAYESKVKTKEKVK